MLFKASIILLYAILAKTQLTREDQVICFDQYYKCTEENAHFHNNYMSCRRILNSCQDWKASYRYKLASEEKNEKKKIQYYSQQN